MKSQAQATSRSVLLVEGTDDQHVLWALLRHYHIPDCFEVTSAGGVERLVDHIRVRLKIRTGEEDRLGVILDADDQIDQRWMSVANALKTATGVTLSTTPDSAGTIVVLPDGGRFGVWVMPDNRSPGCLEDFLLFLRPETDTLLPLVDEFLETLPARELCDQSFPEKDRTKARIHSFLAIQREPGKPMGLAITSRYLDADAPDASILVGWIQRMFVS